MGGINSLSGLNKVSVDFRPAITTIAQKPDKANQPQQVPGADAAIENQPPVKAGSVIQCDRRASEIDQDFFNHLMAMDEDPAKKKAFLDSIAPRVSPDALKATEARLDEAIAHAKKLGQRGKVYGKEQWRNEANLEAMTTLKATLTITKTDGSKVKFGKKIDYVEDYNERKCPSFFKREFFHQMFIQPA